MKWVFFSNLFSFNFSCLFCFIRSIRVTSKRLIPTNASVLKDVNRNSEFDVLLLRIQKLRYSSLAQRTSGLRYCTKRRHWHLQHVVKQCLNGILKQSNQLYEMRYKILTFKTKKKWDIRFTWYKKLRAKENIIFLFGKMRKKLTREDYEGAKTSRGVRWFSIFMSLYEAFGQLHKQKILFKSYQRTYILHISIYILLPKNISNIISMSCI